MYTLAVTYDYMLTLYYKPTCPFCRRVIAVVERLELEVERKDIVDEPEYAEELVEKGGKRQVPYLIDTENNVAMYESDDIVDHLQKYYGDKKAGAPRVHVSDATCQSCEG